MGPDPEEIPKVLTSSSNSPPPTSAARTCTCMKARTSVEKKRSRVLNCEIKAGKWSK